MNEPLMRVWDGKIRAENVLVGGGGIELASDEGLLGEGGTLRWSVQSLLSFPTLRRLWSQNFRFHVVLMVPNVSQSNPKPDNVLFSSGLSSVLDGW